MSCPDKEKTILMSPGLRCSGLRIPHSQLVTQLCCWQGCCIPILSVDASKINEKCLDLSVSRQVRPGVSHPAASREFPWSSIILAEETLLKSRAQCTAKGASGNWRRQNRHKSGGVRVRFRVRFQVAKAPFFGGFPLENPTNKATASKFF